MLPVVSRAELQFPDDRSLRRTLHLSVILFSFLFLATFAARQRRCDRCSVAYAARHLLSRIHAVQECDARDDAMKNHSWLQKIK
jgi:hypothetical protein